jgi:hypothetical protein
LLKIVKADYAWPFFTIFDPIMKKQLLGILLILLFLQPLVSNALAYHSIHNPALVSHKLNFSKGNSSLPNCLMETLVLEAEDEDELFEAENATNPTVLIFSNQYKENKFFPQKLAIHFNSINTQYRSATKPLYILWSVFRI